MCSNQLLNFKRMCCMFIWRILNEQASKMPGKRTIVTQLLVYIGKSGIVRMGYALRVRSYRIDVSHLNESVEKAEDLLRIFYLSASSIPNSYIFRPMR